MADGATMQRQSILDNAPRIPARGGSTKVRRFNGRSRRTADWDGLRKDTQLWSDDDDCLIHLYAYGTSQRGASLRVPFEAIQKLNCSYLIDYCLHSLTPPSPSDDSRDSGYGSGLSTITELEPAAYNIHIPVPTNLSRIEAFSYHLTTRNVVAYAVGKPVVGEKLSTALLDLWKRLGEWLPRHSLRAQYTTYLNEQGYLTFAENAEHALACLKFAEEARFREIWTNAFAHCAGMHERLYLSPEFAGVSKTTAALLTRASLEMDLHINRVMKSLSGFLEEELGPEHLGLSKVARDHLDHFRSFLHAYYVDKFGWYPPPQRSTWDKRVWREMHQDFQRLYDYLVDRDSTHDWTSSRGATGGVCMYQNVHAFDERHGYNPLPHPLALLPHQPTPKRRRSIHSQTALRSLKLGRTNSIPEAKITASQALAIATNSLKYSETERPLIQQYQRFERQPLDSKLDIVEARKVRWLLIYGVFQMLTSIMNGPNEVTDGETTSYPVCVMIHGAPAFEEGDDTDSVDHEDSSSVQSTINATLVPDALDALEGRSSRISIHPDCEADSAEDFFASNSISRTESSVSLNQTASSSRPTGTLSRSGSLRNSMQFSVQALHKSLVGSLNRRNSRRLSLPVEPRKTPSFCEIVVEDYGNGLTIREEDETSRPQTAFHSNEEKTIEPDDAFKQFDFDLPAVNGEPVLEHGQLDVQTDDVATPRWVDRSPCESYFSLASADLADSNRSSYLHEDEFTDTDMSSWDSDSSKRDSEGSILDTPVQLSTRKTTDTTPLKEQLCYRPSSQNLTSISWSVNAGCYTPTGLVLPPTSRFAQHERTDSRGSIFSTASSVYPEESIQAADIPDVEARGRRRSRLVDSVAYRGPIGWTMTAR